MENPRTRGVLNLYGKKAVEEMVSTLLQARKYASGSLIKSLKYEVREALGELFLHIEAADHGVFVENGRRPGGKMPPVDRISEWCRIKGIPERAAWPIARSIWRFGIPPTPFWGPVMNRLDERMAADLEKATALDLEAAIRKDFKELMEKEGR